MLKAVPTAAERLVRNCARAALYLALLASGLTLKLLLTLAHPPVPPEMREIEALQRLWSGVDFLAMPEVQLLQQYIGIDTSEPNANEVPGAEFLASHLAAAGLAPHVERLAGGVDDLDALLLEHRDYLLVHGGDAVCELLGRAPGVSYMIVSEAGASVYSASPLAAEEFPQYDVNLRSAVSIARRLQDPLAELVKIDPKAVGVGQYQHDMPQKRLNETLDGVVEDCVNSVGVDLNTASAPLLARVAGITNATAKNIVAWREEEGAFTSRAQLKKVKGLGPKAFEQCAGFLRLPGAKNPLDATAVHPESYPAAKGLLEACGCDAKEIGTDAMQSLPVRVKSRGTKALCEALGVGEPTLMDIVSELCKPGRDVRDSLPKPLLRSDVMGLEDLKPGMELKGTVRNVIDFGAFVDIGVHQDGLVHVSQISDKFIKNPRDALKVGDVVQVKVLSVDTAKKRIALTMKGVPQS